MECRKVNNGFLERVSELVFIINRKGIFIKPRNQTESVIIYNIAPKKMLFDISYLISWWMVILWILPKISIVKNLGFSAVQVQGLFSLKVVVGIGFTLFYHYYYGSRTSTVAFTTMPIYFSRFSKVTQSPILKLFLELICNQHRLLKQPIS